MNWGIQCGNCRGLNLWAKPKIWKYARLSPLTAHKPQSLSIKPKILWKETQGQKWPRAALLLASWGFGRKVSESSQTTLGKPRIHKIASQADTGGGVVGLGQGWSSDSFSTAIALLVLWLNALVPGRGCCGCSREADVASSPTLAPPAAAQQRTCRTTKDLEELYLCYTFSPGAQLCACLGY